MKVKLKDIASVKAGHPFRGAVKEYSEAEANGYVIQVKNIDNQGVINWAGLTRSLITGRKAPEWLKQGDVIFINRGQRLLAAAIDEPPVQAVSSQHFYVINKTSDDVLPAFLAWQLNQLPTQRYFQHNAEGSLQLSIRRPVLEEIPLTLPPLETQHHIVKLANTALREQQVLTQLIHNRQQQMAAIAADVLK